MTDPIETKDFNLADFPSGSHAWRHIRFADPMRVPITLPIAIARGNSDGPTVLVSSLVHGDEFEGPAAIADFFNALDVSGLSGAFIGLPLTNPWAYAGQSRNTPSHYDDLNLARQFPGNRKGSRTQQHASLLYEWVTRILTEDDVFIDLHSAGTQYEYQSMVGYHPTGDATEKISRELACAFGFENVWQIPESASSTRTFNGSIARAGIPTIGTEVRGQGGLREADIRDLIRGIRNILAHRQMLPDPPAVPDRHVSTTRQVCFTTAGLARVEVDLGDKVTSGQPLGRVVSLQGNDLETLTSPIDGHIWAIRRFASVRPDDIAVLIAQELSK
jgi:predicted deacylase